jgi:uncharacterized glyoxalase superfamily protein PhnB
MPEADHPKRPTLLPIVGYRDPEAAITWLNDAFGFETRRRATTADGKFAYAHLVFGESLIMVTRNRKADCERRAKLPPVGQLAGQRCYFVVDDIEAHCERAKQAGADIVREIKTYEHGGRRYACRDLEGHVWSFGTYDPWSVSLPVPVAPQPDDSGHPRLPPRTALAAAAVALTVVAAGVLVWQSVQTQRRADPAAEITSAATAHKTELEQRARELQRTRAALLEAQAARSAAIAAHSEVLAELDKERSARQEAESSAKELAADLATASATRTAAERLARDLEAHLKAQQESKQQAVQAAAADDAAARRSAAVAAPAPKVEPPARIEAVADITPPAAEPDLAAASAATIAEPATVPMAALPSKPALAAAQAALSRGDITEARQLLEALADAGNADAALALGSTYDPINVARSGLTGADADRAQAKHWYRRALELAQAAGERREEQ